MKCSKAISAIIFFVFLAGFGLFTFILPKKSFSDVENRTLASFPKLSLQSIRSGEFMDGFEKYVSDRFPMRTGWVELKTDAELAAGKTYVGGVYFADDMLIERFDEPDTELADKTAEAVNKFAEKCPIPVYMMIAPTAAGIYTDTLPEYAPQYDQKSYINYFSEQLSDSVTKLDVYSTLYSLRDEYIYYRNDHHWTAFGAYSAYNAAIAKMGFNPVSYSNYDIEHASADFYGTLYSKVLTKKYPADTIDIFHCTNGDNAATITVNDGIEEKTYNSLYFRDYLSVKDKYSTYLGENMPLIVIKNDLPSEKKLLVIKDSYANCFIPYLTQHYSEIAVVDMRKLTSLSYVLDNYIDFSSYSQVLILYNAGTLAQDEDLKKITR